MTLKHVIDTAQKLLEEYGNIYNLIKDKGIILILTLLLLMMNY